MVSCDCKRRRGLPYHGDVFVAGQNSQPDQFSFCRFKSQSVNISFFGRSSFLIHKIRELIADIHSFTKLARWGYSYICNMKVAS